MSISKRSHKLLGSLLLAAGLLMSTSSEAHGGWGGGHGWNGHGNWGGHHGGGWNAHGGWGHRPGVGVYIGPRPGYYYGNPYRSNCNWIAAHWERGYWIPAQKVCW